MKIFIFQVSDVISVVFLCTFYLISELCFWLPELSSTCNCKRLLAVSARYAVLPTLAEKLNIYFNTVNENGFKGH